MNNVGGSNRILLDTPSPTPGLGFDQTAKALAHIIEDSEPRFAVGILGGWGTGKTTLMEAIERALHTEASVSVWFNAWRYEREAHLIVPLLDTIRVSLAEWATSQPEAIREVTVQTTKRIRTTVRRLLLGLASGTGGVPGTEGLGEDVTASEAMAVGVDEVDVDVPQSLYFGAQEGLRKAFATFAEGGRNRIVVFVDDLDRCLPDKALDVLESMKLFFDIPGFVFVVGLDQLVVEEAVKRKFRWEDEEASKAAVAGLQREYVKKVFQVQYSVPQMVPGQLDELLRSIYRNAGLTDTQVTDLRDHVRPYLGYVAVSQRINPRELKRFINAYTLQIMIKPELQADAILALLTLEFRPEWRPFYETMVSESELFLEALRTFRRGDDDSVFENLWPSLIVLPPELAVFFRSNAANSLAELNTLSEYLYSLELSRGGPTWLLQASVSLGNLRKTLRGDAGELRYIGDPASRSLARKLAPILSELSSIEPSGKGTGLSNSVDALERTAQRLAPTSAEANDGEEPSAWLEEMRTRIEQVNDSIRYMRTSLALGR